MSGVGSVKSRKGGRAGTTYYLISTDNLSEICIGGRETDGD